MARPPAKRGSGGEGESPRILKGLLSDARRVERARLGHERTVAVRELLDRRAVVVAALVHHRAVAVAILEHQRILRAAGLGDRRRVVVAILAGTGIMARASLNDRRHVRSEEHTSELQSLMRTSYAVFCLKKKKKQHTTSN